ncbi:Molybdopterin synthase catalytic subunit 1 [Corynebacterium gerontici]|uniref:Molybdopterin synthase catalytic subunit 1 n=1 Tax=Corynebacterium gerontici TaxID=2079234 RepID=A0A3G6J3U0_9CORY|nr:Molybdopterin synthase catalytic subunit 1 [Corynebacterium gerontici]
MRTARVLVASTRAAAGTYQDTTGPLLVQWLREQGFETSDPLVVADREVRGGVEKLLGADVVITTGGTGISPDDQTVEAVQKYIDRPMPGVMHAIWEHGLRNTKFAVLSRGVAGMAGRTFVCTLPGSHGGVKDGMAVLEPLLGAIVDTAAGQAHEGHDPAYVKAQAGIIDAFITDHPIDAGKARELTATRAMGAVVTFDGVVRDHDGGEPVADLTYTAHPNAAGVMRAVVERIASQHPNTRIFAVHRTGALQIGDTAFLVVAAAAHRHDAFYAAMAVADAVKAEVPIWKEQHLSDGRTQWVGIE